jgi:hypothetical protein
MRKLTFALLFATLISSSAFAQYYIVPGGALRPNGGLAYDLHSGAPFSLRFPLWDPAAGHPPGSYPSRFWAPDTPTYWVAYPLVTVPTGKLPPPEEAPKPTIPSPSLSPSQTGPRQGVRGTSN